MELLVVRHPETEANVAGRFVGQGESPFTAEGARQARRLPVKIARFGPDVLWSSPLARALVVARRAQRLCSARLRVDERLTELDFGDAHGMTAEEIAQASIDFDCWSLDKPVARGGESREQLRVRVAAVLDEALDLDGRHAVVCHAGVMRAALAHTLGLSGHQIWHFKISTAQMALLSINHGNAHLVEYRQG